MTLNWAGCRGPQTAHKVTGGYRSAWGAEASAVLMTILATARTHGHNLLDALRAVAGPSALVPADLPS